MIAKITDIVGIALILGLLLRYGESASKLIQSSAGAGIGIYNAVSLQTTGNAKTVPGAN